MELIQGDIAQLHGLFTKYYTSAMILISLGTAVTSGHIIAFYYIELGSSNPYISNNKKLIALDRMLS